ncbi:MAG: tetratricopeptide repeat protein [Candidatus Hodarchaeota archaeon]
MAIKCPKCHSDNLSDSKFCKECGTQLHPVHAETKTLSTPVKDSTIGEVVSEKYKLLEELGSGGMGVVYKAEQIKPVKRSVALKIIKLGMDTRQVVARFETERQALAIMDHPNIAKVFDGGSTETGRPYFVMELVRGIPLTDYCDKHKLTTKERLELFLLVCQAVQHAHQKGVIHRDLKPSNILVVVQEDKPIPKIIDFGIAKATEHSLTERTLYTEQGQLIGTPEYMSPEQAEMSGLDVDTRTDIYSLGVILYELLVGVLPFDPKSLREAGFSEIQRIIRETDPPKASTRLSCLGDTQTSIAEQRKTDPNSLKKELKGDLDWITVKAMAKDRIQRYASASELAADIGRYMRHEPVTAGRPSATYRIRKYIKRHKVGVAAAALIVIAIMVGITGTTIGLLKAKKAEKKAVEEAETAQQVSDFLVNLFEVSDPSEARGNTITAREILDQGAKKIEVELAEQPVIQARLMKTIGSVFHNLGLYKEAKLLLERALKIRKQVLGSEAPEVADGLEDLGNILNSLGEFEESQKFHEYALELREKIFGPEHSKVAGSLNNLANLFQDVGDYETAKPLYERVIDIWEKTEGPESTDLAAALNNFGLLLYETGNYEEARRMYERSLLIKEKILGEVHPDITDTLHNMGMLLADIGERQEARKYFERVISIDEKIFGPEHPHLANTLRSLGILFAQDGEFEQAHPIFERVIEIDKKAFGEEHARVGSDFANLGLLNSEMGNFVEARLLLEKGAMIKERTLGADHPLVANDKSNLAELYVKLGDFEKALPLYERALAIRKKTPGAEHPIVAITLDELGHVLTKMGRSEKAEPLFEQALAIQEKALDPDHSDIAITLNNYAELLCEKKDYERAQSMLERALKINEKAFGADHPEVAVSLRHLSKLLCEKGEYVQAESFFKRALQIQETKLGLEHPEIAETLENYANLLRKIEKREKAEELEMRAEKIKAKIGR